MTKKTIPPDENWSEEARSLWISIHADYVLDFHHSTLLRQACELLTRAHQARQQVVEHGLAIVDRYGCPKPNPFLDVERSSINALRLVLRELGLDMETGVPEEKARIHRPAGYA